MGTHRCVNAGQNSGRFSEILFRQYKINGKKFGSSWLSFVHLLRVRRRLQNCAYFLLTHSGFTDRIVSRTTPNCVFPCFWPKSVLLIISRDSTIGVSLPGGCPNPRSGWCARFINAVRSGQSVPALCAVATNQRSYAWVPESQNSLPCWLISRNFVRRLTASAYTRVRLLYYSTPLSCLSKIIQKIVPKMPLKRLPARRSIACGRCCRFHRVAVRWSDSRWCTHRDPGKRGWNSDPVWNTCSRR